METISFSFLSIKVRVPVFTAGKGTFPVRFLHLLLLDGLDQVGACGEVNHASSVKKKKIKKIEMF